MSKRKAISQKVQDALNQDGKKRSLSGKKGSLFAHKDPKTHPIAQAYLKLREIHPKDDDSIIPITTVGVDILAQAIIDARKIHSVQDNVISYCTVIDEVEDVCQLKVSRTTLVRQIDRLEAGIVRKSVDGRPSIFTSDMISTLLTNLEQLRRDTGSVLLCDIKREAVLIAQSNGHDTFQASKEWLSWFLLETKAKVVKHSKAMEVVRSLKTQPEMGFTIFFLFNFFLLSHFFLFLCFFFIFSLFSGLRDARMKLSIIAKVQIAVFISKQAAKVS